MARKIDELPEDNCNQTQLQKKFLQTLHLLIAQENVYDDLHDTMFLKDPVNFFNTLNSVIQKISICITKLEHNLDREHLDYLMLFKDVHDLMGHGSCIGIKILRDACKTMLSCALMKNTEGCSKCLVTVKTAFIDVKQKLHLLFEIEQKLLTAGWTIPPSNVIYLPPSFDTLIDKRDVHNEFGHLLFLKNQSTIEDFNNFLTLVVQDTSILLDDLETNLLSFEEDEINFLKMYMDLHVAMGHSSCIGANILKKEFHAVLTCTKSKYIEGIPSYLAEAKKELFNIVRKLSFFFEYNAGRSPNYKSEATEVNYNHEASQMQNLYEYHIKVLLDEGILNNTFAELQLKSSPNSVNEIFDNFFDFVHGKLHDLGKLVKCEVKDFSLIKTFLGELIEPCSRVGAEAILSACVSLRILTKDQRQEGLAESWIQLVHASKNFKDKMKPVLALRSIDAAVNLPIKLPINTEIGASFARYQLEFISSAEELLDKGIVTRLFDDSANNPGFLAFTLNQLFDETGSLLDKSASLLEHDLESILQIDGSFLDKVRDIRDRSFYIGLNRLHSAFESFLIYFDANFFEDTWYKNCIKCLAQARNALVEAKAELGGFLMLQEKLVRARGSVPKLRSKHTSAKHT